MPSEGTPHRRGAFRLVALVVFEVFANSVVNALIKDLPIPNYQLPKRTMNNWELGPWELGVNRVLYALKPPALRAERRRVFRDDHRPVHVARQDRSVEDVKVVVRDAEHVPEKL